MVYGSYQRIEQFGGETKRANYCYESMFFLNEYEFADRVYSDYGFLQANTWNFLIKREIYLKNNIRHKAVNYWEDFSTTIDLPTYVTRVILLPNVTYYYYCRYGSLSNFDKRDHIDKSEIEKTIAAMGEVKNNSERLKSMPYFHKRMFKVMMTHFYMACSILKEENIITPSFSKLEIRNIVRWPISFMEVLKMKGWRMRNLALYLLGVLPASLSVSVIRMLGKRKGLL